MKLKTISNAVLIALSASALVACGSSDDDSDGNGKQLQPANLQFSFGLENTKEIANDRNIPMPNDLYFIGEDGSENTKLTVYGCGESDSDNELPENIVNGTKCSLEDLSGWSTTAPFTIPMSGDGSQLDTDTFAESIRIFAKRQLPFPGYSELRYDKDFTVRVTEFNHLQILPLKPLAGNTAYVLAVTKGLKSTAGEVVKRSPAFESLLNEPQGTPRLASYKEKVDGLFTELNDESITPDSVLYIAGFKTQKIGAVLKNLLPKRGHQPAGFQSAESPDNHLAGAVLPPEMLDTIVGKIIGGVIGVPDIDPNFCVTDRGDGFVVECVRKLQATITLPYYLADSNKITASNCQADLSSQDEAEFWFGIDGIKVAEHESYFESYRYTSEKCPSLYSVWDVTEGLKPAPVSQGEQELAVQVVLPNRERNPMPEAGWPVVIFSHGITAAKEFGNGGMLLLDNFVQAELANQGYAVIAIDHPLHNTRAVDIDGDESYDINVSQSLRGLFPGHEQADVKNFLKADALLTSRDNLRQSIADLINLRASVGDLTYVDSEGQEQVEPLDADNVYVMGHSMGSIAGASFSGIVAGSDQALNGSILANPGGGIGGILMNSVWLGHSEVPPAIKAMPEYRLRMAKELGIEQDLTAVREYAEQNPQAYKQQSDQLSPEFLSEFQYLMQAVVDTVDPLNYADALQDTPILSFSVTGSISEQPGLQDIPGSYLTTGDQTVPIKVELDGQTAYEVCNSASMEAGSVATQELGCFNGSSLKPYFSLNTTEFPLAGATPLEETYGLKNTLNSTERSYTRFLTGTHNIGAGTLTSSETEGNADYSSVDGAATELAVQAASFVKYTLTDGAYVPGSHRVAPVDLTVIEK
ncbi:hypothetical protein MD588_01495 [Photobacterium sp. SDRW27]|uniref:hypothetical protein n=1 Tax=Photobacterium obscurum TaxID=2829490 RepID=UPI00224329BF|nr:hypothetical protein [Photobacterium obscurum]MCW8327475.1 hypothetical protein [Photobacterium obscurum]